MQLINDITALVREIPRQCDMLAGMGMTFHTETTGGGVGIHINIRVRREPEHWRSLSARNDDEHSRLLSELTDFIVDHRIRKSIDTKPGAWIGSDSDALPPLWVLEEIEEEGIL